MGDTEPESNTSVVAHDARPGLRLVTTDYGPAALAALHREVGAAKADDPLAPVTVVAPSNYVAVSLRRRLAGGQDGPVVEGTSGIAALHLLTVHRLAEIVGGPMLAGRGRRPWSSPVLGAAARRSLVSSPDLFPGVSDHPATEQAVVGAFRELAGLDQDDLARLRPIARVAPVIAFHDAMRRRLAPHFYGESDLLDAAVRAISADVDGRLTEDLGTVVVYLPQVLTPAELRLLRTLSERAPVVVLVGLTGEADADDDVRDMLRFLQLRPSHQARRMPRVHRTISTSDADDEIRHAIRVVVDAAQRGIPLERIAILYSTSSPYALAVPERLEAARIPFNGVSPRRLADSVAGRTLLRLLALGDRDAHIDDLMSLLGSAPLRDRNHRLIPATAWQRLLREVGVVRGSADRRAELEDVAAELRSALDDPIDDDDDRGEMRRRAMQRRSGHIDALIEFLDDLDRDLHSATTAGTWAGSGMALRRILRDRLGGERVRESWPQVERDAAVAIEGALERLDGLDTIEDWPGADVTRRTLELELDDRLTRLGRFGEGVLVGPVGIGVGLDLDVVVVVGASEGNLPHATDDDPLLPDHLRERVRQLRPRSVRIGEQHRHFLAALAAGATERVVLFARGDLRKQAERLPSRWVVAEVARRTNRRPGSEEWAGGHLEDFELVPSFVAGLRLTAFPASEQEYDLRSALDHIEAGRRLDDHQTLLLDEGLARSLRAVRARAAASMTDHDGLVTGVSLPDVTAAGRPLSPTRLQDYAVCPFDYFVRHVLDVEVPDDERDDDHRMSPLESGSVVHDVLEAFIGRYVDGTVGLEPDQPWTVEEQADIETLIDSLSRERRARGRLGHPALWARHRSVLRRIVFGILEVDQAARRNRHQRPVRVEQAFGLPGAPVGPAELRLDDHRVVRFRGKIDRLDAIDGGGYVVVDYKSGKSRAYAGLAASSPDGDGTLLQLPVYALAARALVGDDAAPVIAEYWFPDGRVHGYAVDDQVLDRFRYVVTTLVDAMAQGLFPARPAADVFHYWTPCRACDPDGLGTRLAHRRWLRKRTDPRLAAFVALVEPESEDP